MAPGSDVHGPVHRGAGPVCRSPLSATRGMAISAPLRRPGPPVRRPGGGAAPGRGAPAGQPARRRSRLEASELRPIEPTSTTRQAAPRDPGDRPHSREERLDTDPAAAKAIAAEPATRPARRSRSSVISSAARCRRSSSTGDLRRRCPRSPPGPAPTNVDSGLAPRAPPPRSWSAPRTSSSPRPWRTSRSKRRLTCCDVALQPRPRALVVEVRDDGVGAARRPGGAAGWPGWRPGGGPRRPLAMTPPRRPDHRPRALPPGPA